MWETHPDLKPAVHAAWEPNGHNLTAGEVRTNLEALANNLGDWSRTTFGSVRGEIRCLKKELDRLRSDCMRVGPSHAEIKINDRLVELYLREELMWRQRSRVEWLSAGHRNSRFFHMRASMRRRKNLIKALQKPDGEVTTELTEMQQMALEFYKQLYTSEGVVGIQDVLQHVPLKVTAEMNASLLAPYVAKEVRSALFQMFPRKAQGPDGFPAHFFQRHWDVCGEAVTRAVLAIVRGEESPACLNDTLLVLIPKVSNPTLLTQFRPISLCNMFYKIASKVLANRLKSILPDIISEEQSAFVPGRLITDNIISAYECLHFMKRNRSKNSSFAALKLDMMKAYDRVEWTYLRVIMEKLGFAAPWVTVVMNMVSSVSFSIMFNGVKSEVFNPTRGIRQGDPISPYLFLLAAEGLSCLLKSQNQSSQLSGIKLAPSAPVVNQLLFADDSLLFFRARVDGAEAVSNLLDTYCLASGQRINKDKSSIFFSKGCPEIVRDAVKGHLQVPNESLSDRYLGMPTDVGHSKKGTFKYLSDRVWDKVKGWMSKCLSAGGKDVLIKSVRSELLSPATASWNEALVRTVFLPMDADAILKIPREEWLNGSSVSSHTEKDEKAWTSLWKLKIPSKVRIFLSRLAHQSLPTTDVLKRRNMSDRDVCPLCGCEDSWRHALVACTMSRCVWALSDENLVSLMSENEESNARIWLFELNEKMDHASFTRMVITLWSIWYARRKAIYESIFQSPQHTASFINNYIDELGHMSVGGVQVGTPVAAPPRPKRWLPPPSGTAKINVDGAVVRSRRGGAVAALCRDQEGHYLGSSAMVYYGITDPLTLETYACREALALADDLGQQKICVASHCQEAVNDINRGTGGPNAALVHEIMNHYNSFISCSFVFERRNFNYEVHNLAKFACNLDIGRHVWLGNPHDPNLVPMTIALE
ncbi:uncharacterized protein [Aegilops tauschii subsp. strangulata]|uniref:uncharacterized protein n=1 Tax=Aegilops tauschii subsp. strangulata TaxID=200361 RepID=UPI003CC85C2B